MSNIYLKKWPDGTLNEYMKWKKKSTHGNSDRPSLEVQYGVFYSFLVVFAHVLVHVRIVGADVFFCAPVGHCTKLQRRVLLLWMLKLSHQKKKEGERGRKRDMRHTERCTNLSDLFLSTVQTDLQHCTHTYKRKRAAGRLKVPFMSVFYVTENCGN